MAWSRQLGITFAAAFLFFMGFYALLVPFPIYLTHCGLTEWQVGVVLGGFGVATVLGRPLAGLAADRHGYMRVMCSGIMLLVVGAAAVPFTHSPAMLFGLRVAQALGYAAFTTAVTARVADLVDAEYRGAALATFGVSVNLAMAVTPMVVSASLEALTVRGSLWFAACLASAAALPLLLSKRPAVARDPTPRHSVRTPLSVLRMPMAASFIPGVGFGTFFQFVPLLAERRPAAPAGAVYATYGVAIIVVRLSTAPLQSHRHRRHLLWPAFLCLAAGLFCMALSTSAGSMLLGAALVAIGSGIVHPGVIATAVDVMPTWERARAVASVYLAFDLGIGLGVWMLTPVFTWSGTEAMFVSAGAISACGALFSAGLPLSPICVRGAIEGGAAQGQPSDSRLLPRSSPIFYARRTHSPCGARGSRWFDRQKVMCSPARANAPGSARRPERFSDRSVKGVGRFRV